MADTKITGLTPIGTLHPDDLLMDVDVHDATMAPTGTNKRLTVAQLFGSPGTGNLIGWEGVPTPIILGAGLSLSYANGVYTLAATGGGGGSGTVTSVGFQGDGTLFQAAVSGSPVTTSGVLGPALATHGANTVLAGPTSGPAAAPTFRALASADLPVFGAAGASHAAGAVPDPGATAHASPYLLGDSGAWVQITGSGVSYANGVYTITGGGGGGGSTTPGGASGQIQYDSNGAFGGSANAIIDGNGLLTLPSTTTPGAPTSGNLYQVANGLAVNIGGLEQRIGGLIGYMRDGSALTNSSSAGDLSTGATLVTGTFTIPANRLQVGSVVRFRASGIYTGNGSIALNFRIMLGGTSGTVVLNLANAQYAPNATNQPWSVEGLLAFRAVGATGSVNGTGILRLASSSLSTSDLSVSFKTPTAGTPATVATNINQVLTISPMWGSASTAVSIQMNDYLMWLED